MFGLRQVPKGKRLGRSRLQLAEMLNGRDQVEFARQVIAPGTQIHTDGALVFNRLSNHGFTHHPTPGYLASDPDAVMPGPHPVSSLLITMDRRHPAPPDQPATPALLPRRVHLPVQPADLPSSRAAVLPVAAAGRRHRPAPPQRAHRRHRQRLGRIHRRLSLNCTQAAYAGYHHSRPANQHAPR